LKAALETLLQGQEKIGKNLNEVIQTSEFLQQQLQYV
jgi:hypothetical protein